MEKELKEYREFIGKSAGKSSRDLSGYHREMVRNFQHERLVHLIIMLFFVFISLCFVGLSVALCLMLPCEAFIYLWPMYGATLILAVVTGFYVRHYYVLENGVQQLYKYSTKIFEK